jgi:NADH-quinone oxidoreductase subunit K
MTIVLSDFLSMTTFLFLTGMIGVIMNKKNIIITLLSLELMMCAVNLNFIIFSIYFDDIIGQIFVIFVLTIAACESSLGLAILAIYNHTKKTISFDIIKNQIFNIDARKRRDLNPYSSA